MKNKIPVFFAIDNSYAPFLAVALNSLADNSSKEREYEITVLTKDLKRENIRKLKKFERDNIKITFKNMNSLDMFDDIVQNRFRNDYIIAIYFRLFIAAMFPDLDKAVYLDSDIVINEDIARLYDTDIKDNLIGACFDTTIAHNRDFYTYTEKAVGVNKNEYINSGVLLMNLKEMRRQKFEEHFLSLLNEYHFDSVAPDQDYINAICNGKIYYLENKWNTMPNDFEGIIDNPYIIHYNLFSKPWHYSGVQYEEYFWQNALKSGYLTEILKIRNSFDEEKQKKNNDCFIRLMERTREITQSPITFNSMFRQGVRVRI